MGVPHSPFWENPGYFHHRITVQTFNISVVNRVSELLVRSKMAITLELKLCLSNFSRVTEKNHVINVQILNFHASS